MRCGLAAPRDAQLPCGAISVDRLWLLTSTTNKPCTRRPDGSTAGGIAKPVRLRSDAAVVALLAETLTPFRSGNRCLISAPVVRQEMTSAK